MHTIPLHWQLGSQSMAEALLRKYGADRFAAHSAGLEPQGLHPFMVKVVDEIGIDVFGQTSKGVDAYQGKSSSNISSPCAMMPRRTATPSGPESVTGSGAFKTGRL